MSKVGKIAIYAAKQYAKEQERKRKLEEKEQLRIAKERAANEERVARIRNAGTSGQGNSYNKQ